jgi:hypothetical protein
VHLLTLKQRETESLKDYMSQFNKKMFTMDKPKENIVLATLLGGVWLRGSFMLKLARRIPATLREFKEKVEDFMNIEDIIQALRKPNQKESGRSKKKKKKKKESRGDGD